MDTFKCLRCGENVTDEIPYNYCHECMMDDADDREQLAALTAAADALRDAMQAVKDYYEGNKQYNFAGLRDMELADARMVAWEEIYQNMTSALKHYQEVRNG